MKAPILLFYLCMLLTFKNYSQQLILSGKITFERKENMHKHFTEQDSWSEYMLQHSPKYRTDLFQLNFNLNKSLYKLIQEDEYNNFIWYKVAINNTVAIDFIDSTYLGEKTIYEKSFLIEDSLPQLNWKIIGEYREIAGFNCRKATTIIKDSVYIIAFYSDQIPVSGGPESFTGLPGMILGLVVPRLNLTYFAIKVESQVIPQNELIFKELKKKKKTFKAYNDELKVDMNDWGDSPNKIIWKANL